MKATFQERLTLVIAKTAKRMERWQERRVEKAKALVEKRKAAHLDIALIGADAFTDYRLLKRDRYHQMLDVAEGELKDSLAHAKSLHRQANSLENAARITYQDARQALEDNINAIYKEQLA